MKYLKYKDQKNRILYSRVEQKRVLCKSLYKSEFVEIRIRHRNKFRLNKGKPFRNRCIYSGRGRAVLSEFGMSRQIFKEFADAGFLYGIRVSTW